MSEKNKSTSEDTLAAGLIATGTAMGVTIGTGVPLVGTVIGGTIGGGVCAVIALYKKLK